jgi:hypothetical protein
MANGRRRENDTKLCTEPLHRNHRVGAFRAPSGLVQTSPPFGALRLARDGISQVFGYYGWDIGSNFQAVEVALTQATRTRDWE